MNLDMVLDPLLQSVTSPRGGEVETTSAGGAEGTGVLQAGVPPRAEAPAELVELSDPRLYVNRELSLLGFLRRVLEEARDPANPLLERVKFLSIVGSNMDEFFMVRVAGLKQQIEAGVVEISPDGLTPAEQLAAVRKAAAKLMQDARDCLFRELLPQLEEAGVASCDYTELNEKQLASVKTLLRRGGLPGAHAAGVRPGPALSLTSRT